MIDEIIKRLHISDATSVISLRGQEQVKKLQITHILTVSAMCIPERSQIPGVEYKFLFALDMSTQDMFADNLLIEALDFIECALKEDGNVLVHCEVGISRSAFIVAAYLMRRYRWSVDKALTHIRSCRPTVQPNDGFVRQLMIFQHLGYKADFDSLSHSAEYRNWCHSTGHIYQMMPMQNGKDAPKNSEAEFVCRKCRKLLFYDDHLLKHTPQEEQNGTADASSNGQSECSFGFLLTPMKWMDLSAYEGKVFCPSCNEKLGNYVWGGRVCRGADGKSCGTAVRPWVQIHKGKVDKKVFRKGKVTINEPSKGFCPPAVFIEPPNRDETDQADLNTLSLSALSVEDATGRLNVSSKIASRRRSKSMGSADATNAPPAAVNSKS